MVSSNVSHLVSLPSNEGDFALQLKTHVIMVVVGWNL